MISNVRPNVIGNVKSNTVWIGGVPTATITHTKNGTFSITFRGTNGAVIYCDPGDESPVQPKTLLGPLTDVVFSYANDGTPRTVRVSGAINSVSHFVAPNMAINSDVSFIRSFSNIEWIDISNSAPIAGVDGSIESLVNINPSRFIHYYNTGLSGDVSVLLSLWYACTYFHGGSSSYTCSLASYPCSGMVLSSFYSCFSSSDDVGNSLINLAGVQTSGIIQCHGTNPAPPAAPEVTAAIAQLAGDGVTLYLN